MLLMIEKSMRGGIFNLIHQYAKASKKHMNDYDENKESSYINYCDVNNLYGWAMMQKLPTVNFKWVIDTPQFNKVFKKNYNEKGEAGYILDVHIKYLEKIYEFHWDLTFLPQRKKKIEKLVTNLCDKSEYVLVIRNLKQALKHGLLFKKVHRGISFNQ